MPSVSIAVFVVGVRFVGETCHSELSGDVHVSENSALQSGGYVMSRLLDVVVTPLIQTIVIDGFHLLTYSLGDSSSMEKG